MNWSKDGSIVYRDGYGELCEEDGYLAKEWIICAEVRKSKILFRRGTGWTKYRSVAVCALSALHEPAHKLGGIQTWQIVTEN